VSRIGAEVVDSQTDIATAFFPFDQATQDDYVAGLERARAERIFYSAYLSAWVIARYDDIDAVLRDPVSFSSKGVLPMSAEPDVREAIAGVVRRASLWLLPSDRFLR
jgi:cytochrome P450